MRFPINELRIKSKLFGNCNSIGLEMPKIKLVRYTGICEVRWINWFYHTTHCTDR